VRSAEGKTFYRRGRRGTQGRNNGIASIIVGVGFGCFLHEFVEAGEEDFGEGWSFEIVIIFDLLQRELALVGHALEVGAHDLHGVEDGGGRLLLERAMENALHDLVEGDLEREAVFDFGEGGTSVAEAEVEAAVVAVVQGGLGAALVVEADVFAAGRFVGRFDTRHGIPPPSRCRRGESMS
jgi:hypothetical protein